jgi:hypothetical protein
MKFLINFNIRRDIFLGLMIVIGHFSEQFGSNIDVNDQEIRLKNYYTKILNELYKAFNNKEQAIFSELLSQQNQEDLKALLKVSKMRVEEDLAFLLNASVDSKNIDFEKQRQVKRKMEQEYRRSLFIYNAILEELKKITTQEKRELKNRRLQEELEMNQQMEEFLW